MVSGAAAHRLCVVCSLWLYQARAVEFFPIENAGGSTYDYEKGYAVAGLITVSAGGLPLVFSSAKQDNSLAPFSLSSFSFSFV